MGDYLIITHSFFQYGAEMTTSISNKEIVKVFKEAKKIIESGKESYICYAIQSIRPKTVENLAAKHQAKNIVQTRLDYSSTCEGWLWMHTPRFDLSYEEMRLYRLAWLDRLIAEFS